MKNAYQNREARPDNRMPARLDPTPPQPVERVLVQPPPESRIKCPHCGAAGRLSTNKATHGTIPRTGENRRTCTSCGAKLAFTTDWRSVRVIG
jgi:hypothetical protein